MEYDLEDGEIFEDANGHKVSIPVEESDRTTQEDTQVEELDHVADSSSPASGVLAAAAAVPEETLAASQQPQTDAVTSQLAVDQQSVQPDIESSAPFRLMDLPLRIRQRIISNVLLEGMEGAAITPQYLERLHSVFRVDKQLRMEARNILSWLPLRIETPLHHHPSYAATWQRFGIGFVYDTDVQNLTMKVTIIHIIAATSFRGFLVQLQKVPGSLGASELLCADVNDGAINSFHVRSRLELIEHMMPTNNPQTAHYVTSFTPLNHAYMFGWIRWANVGVTNLTIHVDGARHWSNLTFGDNMRNRSLPLVSLMASIIAFKPRGLKKIILIGVGEYRDTLTYMWSDKVPKRTPLTGHHAVLDQLVQFPFRSQFNAVPAGNANASAATAAPQGIRFGLMTSIQWQAMIMNAAHGKNQPVWFFRA